MKYYKILSAKTEDALSKLVEQAINDYGYDLYDRPIVNNSDYLGNRWHQAIIKIGVDRPTGETTNKQYVQLEMNKVEALLEIIELIDVVNTDDAVCELQAHAENIKKDIER